MTTTNQFEELEIWQLAQLQAERFNGLLATIPFETDSELKTHLQTATASVGESIAEAKASHRSIPFRKNFLVIAKSFNREVCTLLHQLLEKEHLTLVLHNELLQMNKAFEAKIVSSINHLQQNEACEDSFVNQPSTAFQQDKSTTKIKTTAT